MISLHPSRSEADVAALADLALATIAIVTGIWIVAAGDTLGRTPGDDYIGVAPWDIGVLLAFGGPAIALLVAAAFMLRRRWHLAWVAHWLAVASSLVFGAAVLFLLA